MKYIKQYQRRIVRSIVSLASLFVIFLCAAHIVIPLVSPHTDYFEKLLSRNLHHPVSIRQVDFGWRGLNPQLRFSDIAVKNSQANETILVIKKLNFNVGFFSSLWHREILPSAISISGAQLDVYQNSDGSWELLNNQKNNSGNALQIWNWILAQSHISLSNINLTVHYANGVALVIEQLQLELKQKHYPKMTGTLLLASGGTIDFSWKWLDQSAGFSHSELYLKANKILLEPWLNSTLANLGINKLPLLSGEINGEMWLNWRLGKFSDLHARIDSPNLSEFDKGVNSIKLAADFFVANNNVLGSFDIDDISKLKQFIPDDLSPHAKLWLSNAFLAGSITQAKLNWQGVTKQFNLIVPVNNATLHFAPAWPEVKNIHALLTFTNKKLVIVADSGSISGNPIIHAVTIIPDVTKSVMTIDSQTGGTLQDGLNFLAEAPLPIAPFVAGWQAQGPIIIDLHLAINLKNKKNRVDSSGLVHFKNNNLIAPKQVISWNKIQGELNFKNNNLSAGNLTGEFLDSPANLMITTDYTQARPIYSLNFVGNLTVNQPYLTGSIPYKALLKLSLKNQHGDFLLDGYSSLIGLESTLPAPLAKAKNLALPIRFHLRSEAKQTYLSSLSLANIFSGVAEIKIHDGSFEVVRGVMNIGKDNATLRKNSGLALRVDLPLLNLDDWQAVWNKYKTKFSQDSAKNKANLNWSLATIHIKKLIYQAHAIERNQYLILHQKNNYVFKLKNNLLAGTLISPDKRSPLWQANFDYLNWPAWWRSQGNSDPRSLPNLNFTAKAFSFHGRLVGQLNLNITHLDQGLKINSLAIQSKEYDFKANGEWLVVPHEATHLQGDISTANLGALLVTFGISPVIYQGNGTATFDLHWLAAPSKITAAAATGQLSFSFNDGRIMKLSEQAESDLGLGKLLNLLSLQSLPFTIASGFQSLGEKGFEFNELKGAIDLTNGKGTLKSLSLVGPIAWVTATGDVDFANKMYNLKLTVIPDITSSIPLILALTGGPVAGVIGLVANKILGAQIGKAAEQNITIKGSWKNPQVIKIPKPQTTKAG